ncbi:Ribonucleases P/MRP protein subunit pop1 [Lecanora helva]
MASSNPSVSQKRKQASDTSIFSSNTKRPAKRLKLSNARNILTQRSDKALNNGDLDVSAFVKAREFEIKAMHANMGASKSSLSTRAFQQLPINLRRRTASHNVKKVPKRLRARAAKEPTRVKMKDDNTPTVTSRRRKPTPHQRLRLEKAKHLQKLGLLTKKRREDYKKRKPSETDLGKVTSNGPRVPGIKKNTLRKPPRPPAKFRKRQIHKSWLPTHLFHAKRAHMTPPKEPLWRFAVPLTPTDKCYRATHRVTTSQGCIAWDMSYMATIGVDGTELSICGLLRSVGVDEKLLSGKRGAKWRSGTRWSETWIRERDKEKSWIAKVGLLWCLDADVPGSENNAKNYLDGGQPKRATGAVVQPERAVMEIQSSKQRRKAPRRKLWLRVHPSAFFQTWNEILKVSMMQRPMVTVEDLRFELGSVEIVGPESTQALIGVLHPVANTASPINNTTGTVSDDEWEDFETPAQIWRQLVAVTNPASLPANAILGFNISDPRLHHPPRTVQPLSVNNKGDTLLECISSWAPDRAQSSHDIFDRAKRLAASRQLPSQKAINRRKSEASPGSYPTSLPKDPQIPVLAMASRTTTANGQGSWIVLLPWDCVLPVWYSLMHYPLSSGGNPRFGGLQEKRQIAFEQAVPWFPADCPGTKAGFEWEIVEREKRRQEWEKRPKGKRIAWESVNLGNNRKGEIGRGWACDWEHLFQEPPPTSTSIENDTTAQESTEVPQPTTFGGVDAGTSSHQDPRPSMHHIINTHPNPSQVVNTSLSPVHIVLIGTGHPTYAARIYRLPTTDSNLRAKWLSLAHPSKSSHGPRPSIRKLDFSTKMAPHERSQNLAATLLAPGGVNARGDTTLPKAGDPSYPCVPDEIDLIGFVTTGNYHLGEGRYEAVGNVAVAKVVGDNVRGAKSDERNLCIVRESGQGLGRLARWRFI